FLLTAVKRTEVQTAGRVRIPFPKEKEMMTVGGKMRKSVTRGPKCYWRITKPSQGNRLTSRGRNAHERIPGRRSKQNGTVCIPGSASRVRRARQRLRGSASDVDAIKPGCGKKSNRSAVGRPERILGAIASSHGLSLGFIERSKPKS